MSRQANGVVGKLVVITGASSGIGEKGEGARQLKLDEVENRDHDHRTNAVELGF